MSSQTVARRYATALVDVIGGQPDERIIQEELLAWESMISSNLQLQEVFTNPTVPADQKRRVLNDLISRTKVHSITANFLQILLKNQRLIALAAINRRFADLLDIAAGVIAAGVTTARPVSSEIKNALSERLAQISGKKVRLSFTTDDSLIGGLVTRVGSTVYDGSIRAQLDRLEKAMAGQERE